MDSSPDNDGTGQHRQMVQFKTEVVERGKPWRSLDDLELEAFVWVDWFNNTRYGPFGYIPPAEHEAAYRHKPAPAEPVGATPGASA